MKGSGKRSSRSGQKRKRRVVKGLFRVVSGPSMVYLTAGTYRAFKIPREEVTRIENATRKHVEEMVEDELVDVMKQMDIESVPLNDDEELIVKLASKYVLMGYFLMTEN